MRRAQITSYITVILVLVLPVAVFAVDTASIQSFEVSATSINSGQSLALYWNATNSGGASLTLSCVPGVKFRNQSGALLACGSKLGSYGGVDNVPLTVINISGSTVSVTATLIPKNADGSD